MAKSKSPAGLSDKASDIILIVLLQFSGILSALRIASPSVGSG